MTATAAQQAFQTALSAGINAALTATSIAPNDYQNWVALGNLYAEAVPLHVSGAYNNAKTTGQAQMSSGPIRRLTYVLAQLDVANKDNKSAEADLKAAIALKQDYTDAIFLLSQLEVQDGDVKDALSAALAAAYFTPNNPNILFQVGILYAATSDFPNAAAALMRRSQRIHSSQRTLLPRGSVREAERYEGCSRAGSSDLRYVSGQCESGRAANHRFDCWKESIPSQPALCILNASSAINSPISRN